MRKIGRDGPQTRGPLRKALASPDREFFDAAIELLTADAGWLPTRAGGTRQPEMHRVERVERVEVCGSKMLYPQ